MTERWAPAKINLALAVGPAGAGGKHEVTTVIQRVGLADRVALEAGPELHVEGFEGDTLVTDALETLSRAAGVEARWAVRIEKEIPVAAGLGGGSSDAAAALLLANATLDSPLPPERLHELAASLGADVPFFLAEGPQLGEGDGSRLTPLALPQQFAIVLVLEDGAVKASTASVYEAFDRRDGANGYGERRAQLLAALAAGDLAALPPNDLASSPLADALRSFGAFRADVSGAGPAVYALFDDPKAASTAAQRIGARGRTWILRPAW
jgi:4-diphosphocytidyl-2-C-methyl-D-erythritol kinase